MAEGGKVTRAREKKRKLDEGIPDDPPKPKIQTLGRYLMDEREKQTKEIEENNDLVNNYEAFLNYEKEDVIKALNAEEIASFRQMLYKINNPDPLGVIFITLHTGEHPKQFSHLCNNASLVWNLKDLKIPSTDRFHMGIPSVKMLFVRGEHVEGTSTTSTQYKYLGLIGLQTVSSSRDSASGEYLHDEARFIFDNLLNKAELAQFGDNCMKCKKNKYGFSLCA